jgi:hypothetical protein
LHLEKHGVVVIERTYPLQSLLAGRQGGVTPIRVIRNNPCNPLTNIILSKKL